MNSGIPALESAYSIFFGIVIVVVAIMAVLCLLRAIIGPRLTDRVVAVNMIGTMIIAVIALLAVMTEGYLADICLIYAMISFLAVIVLTKIYTGVYRESQTQETGPTQDEIEMLLMEQNLIPGEMKEEGGEEE